MDTKTLIALIVIVLVAIGGYFLLSNRASAPQQPVETQNNTTSDDTVTPAENTAIVTYTDGGFSPATISVKVGDTVRFVNNSGSGMWVASDAHPTHTEYDGSSTSEHCANGVNTAGSFDACRQIAPGESYEFTFAKVGTFTYHNHARANHGGTVTVTN